MKKHNNINESGRSMIEMLGVLAIIGVLSVGGIAGYSKAMTKYRINKAIEQITLIAGNIRTFFAPQKSYVGVECWGINCNATNGCTGHSGVDSNGSPITAANGCPIIKKAKILPDEMITVNAAGKITAITNPFGVRVRLYSLNKAQSSGSDYQAFYINYEIDDEEACIELTTHDWTTANVGIISMGSSGAPIGGKSTFKVPMNIDTAVERCATYVKGVKEQGNGYMYLYFYFDVDVNSTYWKNQL